MTTREKAPTILTKAGARRLTDRLVTTLTEAHELLIDLWVGRAWEALEFPNWDAYCKAELGDLLMVKLPPAMRREAAEHMKAAGMSYRNIASPFGVSPASIHADLNPKPVQKLNTKPAPEPLPEPLPPEIIEAMTAWQVVLRHVAHAGAAGLTCLEFEGETGRGHGAASAAFHSCERKSYIKRDGRFRGSYAVYVTATA